MNASTSKPILYIGHALPGRLRLRLSPALRDPARAIRSIKGHEGLHGAAYTPVSQSMLIHYDRHYIVQEEVVLRAALALALDQGAVPVRIVQRKDSPMSSPTALYAGLLIAMAGAMRLVRIPSEGLARFDWVAAAGTLGAVVDHGYREMRQKGYFDPELLSLAYLVSAFARGNVFSATVVTWLTAFGRHLLESPKPGALVRPIQTSRPGEEPHYEVVVGADSDVPEGERALSALQALLRYTFTGSTPSGDLLNDFREISKVHDEMVEGLGGMGRHMPIRVR